MKRLTILLALMASSMAHAPILAQSNDGHAQGEAFAKEQSQKVETETLQGYDPTTVPGYSDQTLTQERYYDEPDGLVGDGSAVARNNEAYKAMRDSDRLRPKFDPDFIKDTAERGTLIEQDPESYLGDSEFSSENGGCKALPPAPGDPSYYEETCNDGLGQIEETNQCFVTREISTTPPRTVYGYFSSHLRGFGYPHDSIFQARPDCRITGSGPNICLLGDPNNCYEPEPTNAWQCQTPVPGQTVRFTEVIPGQQTDVTDTTQCDPYSSDGNCTLIEESCVEWSDENDPAGLYCKSTLKRYQCQGVVQRNDCSELEANPQCTYVRRECLTEDDPCSTYDLVYRCPLPGTEGQEAPQYICDDDIYCVNGECHEVEDEANDELKDALVGLNALADVNEDFDPDTLTIFTGERGACRKAVFGLLNCCSGSSLIPIANLVYCKSDEALLESRFKLGLCHYVGSYCSKKFLACLEKKKVYCCYESKLSRIIQQQGRPQIGKDWEKAKEEQCEGFSLDEFSQLDLSVMDFTEIYSDFLEAVNLPDEAELATELQQKIQDYYNGNPPGGGN